jgi:DNA-binding FrmR family transcriptional regulator
MKQISKEKTIKRMNYLIGHLIANKKMIQDDRYCIDIIRQNNAVVAALKKVNDLILESHLDTCATTAIKSNDEQKREKILKELLEIYQNQ